MSTDQYLVAERRRQLILDCLNAAPGAGLDAIRDYLNDHGERGAEFSASHILLAMADWSEVRKDGGGRNARYYALTRTTRSAAECKGVPRRGQVHRAGDNPNPNPGGQGALRPTVYVNCSGGVYA